MRKVIQLLFRRFLITVIFFKIDFIEKGEGERTIEGRETHGPAASHTHLTAIRLTAQRVPTRNRNHSFSGA